MKILVYIKNPDAFGDAVDDAVRASLKETGLPKDEQDELFDTRREKVWDALNRWVEYQEYVSIEFDTDAMTATVVNR